jgi:hypothetical protein
MKYALLVLLVLGVCNRAEAQGDPRPKLGDSPLLTAAPVFPLKVSTNGRYFVDQSGIPFRINAEAAWLMSVQANAADVDTYLTNRKARGFNSVIVMGMVHAGDYSPFAPQAPHNRAGNQPHAVVGDFSSTPNEAYWSFVDSIIDKAASRGMVVIFAYTYLGYGGGNQGWWQEINQPVNTQEVCYRWGQWLGNRYKDKKNIVWYTLGDYTPPAGSEGSIRTHRIVEGIKSTAPWALFGGEPSPPDALSIDAVDFQDVLDMNSFYGCGPNFNQLNYLTADRAWTYSPTRPAWVGEPPYFGETVGGGPGNRPATRNLQWYAVLGGGTAGDNTGIHNIWVFKDWQVVLDGDYSYDRQNLFGFFASFPWYELMPSGTGGGRLGKKLITSNNPNDASHIVSAANASGTLLVAYTPGTSPFSVDMTAMSGAARARWYDPTNANFMTVVASLPNSGTHVFSTPGSNSSGTADWVLVLDPAVASGPNAAPTVATAASAMPSPATGTTTTLSVMGADDSGESNLTYLWTVTGTPPASVTFSANATHAARSVLATFSAPGSYGFQVTITDAQSASVTSSVRVAVNASTTLPDAGSTARPDAGPVASPSSDAGAGGANMPADSGVPSTPATGSPPPGDGSVAPQQKNSDGGPASSAAAAIVDRSSTTNSTKVVGGCSLAGSAASGAWSLMLLALFGARRRAIHGARSDRLHARTQEAAPRLGERAPTARK